MSAERVEAQFIDQRAWAEGWRKSPIWLRLLGGPKSYYADRGSYRMKWGELSLKPCSIGLSIGGYETAHLHIAVGLAQVFIHLPFLTKAICEGPTSIEQPHFGFAIHPTDVHLNWGRRCKIIYFPWQRRFIFNEYLDAAGEWRPRLFGAAPGAEAPHWSAEYPYHYMLESGEVQHVTATVTRQRHWATWTWFGESTHPAALGRAKRRRPVVSDFLRGLQKRLSQPVNTIDIRFSEEVGARRGSWKGGCVGCSYEMKPGETPRHTLSRMQAERRFR